MKKEFDLDPHANINSFSAKGSFVNIRNYLAGRFIGATRDDVLLHEVVKLLFCRMVGHSRINGSLDSTYIAKIYRNLFAEIKNKYQEIFQQEEEILLDPSSIYYTNNELSKVNLLQNERDPIGDAYEVFIGNIIRGQEGQFFTPKNAINLLVQAIEPKLDDKIIDPACGAGGFLVAVLQYFINNGYLLNEVTEASRNLFGIDKDKYLVHLCKIHLALLTGILPQVYCEDSLTIGITKEYNKFKPNSFDIVLTNPPFGTNIISANEETLRQYKLAKKWVMQKDGSWSPSRTIQRNVPPQVLFIEQCINLAKEGGKIGIVLPESVISSKKYAYTVEYIRNHCDIKAVIGMPEVLFKTSGRGGTHTKTCLVVLSKKLGSKTLNKKIFFAEAKWCGHDSRGKQIPFDDTRIISENLNQYLKYSSIEDSNLGYTLNEKDIVCNILAPRYYNLEIITATNNLMKTHNIIPFSELLQKNFLSTGSGDEVGKLAYGTGPIPFIRTSDISNWEIKADPKHCVSREIFHNLREKQDVKPGDILMVRDGTYLIGTCALVTNLDSEIVYQSHLLKIRVQPNELGLNPYLLLAILSSNYVQQQIKTKCFTQDIIDSLGDRYKELLLPIPKTITKCNQLSDLVKSCIEYKIKARELAHEAMKIVLA